MSDRRYSVEELDQMRADILTTLGHNDYGSGMRYSFSPDGRCTGGGGGGGWGETWGSGEKSPEEKRRERAEDLLRTHLVNGTDPADLRQRAEAHLLQQSLRDALNVVLQRRHQMLPEPPDCRYAKLLIEHGKYPPDDRDQTLVAQKAAETKRRAEQDAECLERLRSCGHLNGVHFLKPTDQCGYCAHGLMPGLVVHKARHETYRCSHCNSMKSEPMVYLPDYVRGKDSPEDIMAMAMGSSHSSGWCLSCAKRRVSSRGPKSAETQAVERKGRDVLGAIRNALTG